MARFRCGHSFAIIRIGLCAVLIGSMSCHNSPIQAQAQAQAQAPAQAEVKSAASSPNFLVIVADDMGYSDLGAFGGEIDTPNLDRLAYQGLRLVNFNTAAACAPTRAMLMTGKDSHYAGVGTVEFTLPKQRGKPGYQLFINQDLPTLAELMRSGGYHTMMSGKWHLGKKPGQTPAERGFESSFALLEGGHNHYNKGLFGSSAHYLRDGAPASWPENAYSSDYFASQMVEMLKDTRNESQPFFAYLTFTAPHWPLQVPDDTLKKYAGRYGQGPEALRNKRIKRQIDLGLLSPQVTPHKLVDVPGWHALTEAEKHYEARKMEIHAAMVDRLDQGVGQVLNELRASGKLANTVVVFLSDNGAEGMFSDENGRWGFEALASVFRARSVPINDLDNSLENLGKANSLSSIGKGWAQAMMAPFRLYKSMPSEGGIHAPAFISGPGIANSKISDALVHVADIFPTLLDLANITYSTDAVQYTDGSQTGRSWRPIINNEKAHIYGKQDNIGWEFFGGSALRRGDWKAVYVQEGDFGKKINYWGPGKWELFNMRTDPGETTDLSTQHPQLMSSLIASWQEYAEANKVVVLFPESQLPH